LQNPELSEAVTWQHLEGGVARVPVTDEAGDDRAPAEEAVEVREAHQAATQLHGCDCDERDLCLLFEDRGPTDLGEQELDRLRLLRQTIVGRQAGCPRVGNAVVGDDSGKGFCEHPRRRVDHGTAAQPSGAAAWAPAKVSSSC
jgi:hypothetical protein